MKNILICLVVTLLTGCVMGQRFDYTLATPKIDLISTGAIAVGTQDRRPYIISGQKKEQFVGLLRGGFGDPHDVNTASGHPFAQDVEDVLVRSISHEGINVIRLNLAPTTTQEEVVLAIKSAKADRAIVLTVNEWKTDSLGRTGLHADLTLEEFDNEGRILRTSQSHGTDEFRIEKFTLAPSGEIANKSISILQKRIEDMFSSMNKIGVNPEAIHKNASDQLKELQQLLERGTITQSEYDRKRKDILEGI